MKIPIDPLRLVPFVSAISNVLGKTLRFEVHGDLKSIIEKSRQGKPYVFALWHGEFLPLISYVNRFDNRFVIMVSQSKDGEFISRLLERSGHITVRGSSSRGGVRALINAKRLMLKEKLIGAVTVDGPRGPRHKVKDGIFLLAQRTGAQIIPLRAYASQKKEFNSWDRFMLPYPFSKCRFYLGEPMDVTTEKLDKDVLKQEGARLEKRMLALGSE
nr:lysophospholipid acyltransferase family protein [uncultured Pseudodesulfovibrio sp.]